MAPYHPDLIIANCPGCTFFLDRWQHVIPQMNNQRHLPSSAGIPVLSFEELAALLLGFNPWDIGLQLHQTQVESLLNAIGINYDPQQKYRGVNGKDLGQPVHCYPQP